MIVVGYGTQYLVILISDTCSNSTSREWSLACPTFIFQKELVKDVLLANILKRSLKKGRLRGPPLHWSSSIVTWWDPFLICPLTRRGMCLHLLMISHDILGCIFLGINPKFFSISNTSKNLQRIIPREQSKSSAQTMGGNMWTRMFKLFVQRLVYSCNIQYHTLHNKIKWLRGRIDPSKIWPLACCMQGLFLLDYGSRHLTVPNTYRIYLLIDMSRTWLLFRNGAVANQNSPTSEYLDHVHGSAFPLKRGKH